MGVKQEIQNLPNELYVQAIPIMSESTDLKFALKRALIDRMSKDLPRALMMSFVIQTKQKL